MPEYITRITDQITERWNQINTGTKVRIIAASAAVVILLVVLSIVLSRPTMIKFAGGLQPSQTNQLATQFTDVNIKNNVSDDASTIYIDSSKQKEATIIADELGVMSDSTMNWEKALESSLTTTSLEKKKKFELALQDDLETKIEALDMVRKAHLTINSAEENTSIFEETIESSATLTLDLKDEITAETIQGIVNNLDDAIKNLSSENISIMDTRGTILFDGNKAANLSGNISNQLEHHMTLEQYEKSKLIAALYATGEFDRVEVALNLLVDFDETKSYSQNYTGLEGGKTGVIVKQYLSDSEGKNSDEGGVPGTDSNDGTDTMTESGSSSENSNSISDTEYKANVVEKTTVEAPGEVDRAKSSCTVILNKFTKYDQELLEKDGALDDTTWEAYKASIEAQDIEVVETDERIIAMVKNYSQMENVVVQITRVPIFFDKEVRELPIANYVSIAFMVLLVALLGFIIYRSTAPEEIDEIEPELSVEEMLESTKEGQDLEEIEFDDKSDIRKQIEKFVDDNPEAVALLLRNWLNEDWE